MIATGDIQRGERILAEQPLVTLPEIPSDMIHPHNFLTERQLASGADTIKTIMAQQPPQIQAALKSLVRHAPTEVSIVATNAYTHEKICDNGVKMSVARVYNEISRINHSCQPNALVEWNDNLQQGTVHALEAIPRGAEILGDYMADVDGCLRTAKQRNNDLLREHFFECECSACRSKGIANGNNDGLRRKAKTLHSNIFWTVEFYGRGPVDAEQIRLEQIAYLNKYIDLLNQLSLKDFKLAEAYQCRAKYHELGSHLAKLDLFPVLNSEEHQATEYEHLQLAAQDWRMAHWIEVRIFGEDHPETQRTSRTFNTCESQLALLPSPTIIPGSASA